MRERRVETTGTMESDLSDPSQFISREAPREKKRREKKRRRVLVQDITVEKKKKKKERKKEPRFIHRHH